MLKVGLIIHTQIFMLKNKIYKYFASEILKSFLTILFAFTAIAWTVRAVNFLDLIVENGHAISTYLYFSLLNITNIITKFIPLSFLMALFLSILKFERQNELIILWTSGFNKIKLANLFFLISVFILIVQLTFATFVAPNSLNKSRDFIKSSDLDSLNSIIRVNNFSDNFQDVTIYVLSKDKNNQLNNIFIRDDENSFSGIIGNNEKSSNTTITAKSGFFNEGILILEDGIIQTQDMNKKIKTMNFKKTQLSMSSLTTRTTTKPKLQETLTSILISCFSKKENKKTIQNMFCPQDPTKITEVIEHLSRRVGMPIYIPLVSLICSFLLISTKKKKYSFLHKYFYFIIAFIILLLAEVLVRYSGFSKINTIIYFSLPIILSPIIYLILLKKLAYEKFK